MYLHAEGGGINAIEGILLEVHAIVVLRRANIDDARTTALPGESVASLACILDAPRSIAQFYAPLSHSGIFL